MKRKQADNVLLERVCHRVRDLVTSDHKVLLDGKYVIMVAFASL